MKILKNSRFKRPLLFLSLTAKLHAIPRRWWVIAEHCTKKIEWVVKYRSVKLCEVIAHMISVYLLISMYSRGHTCSLGTITVSICLLLPGVICKVENCISKSQIGVFGAVFTVNDFLVMIQWSAVKIKPKMMLFYQPACDEIWSSAAVSKSGGSSVVRTYGEGKTNESCETPLVTGFCLRLSPSGSMGLIGLRRGGWPCFLPSSFLGTQC